ncbi:MAG: valyl-tRNA synthetase, partial [Gammaproteobacteria bacterium]
QKRTSGLMQPQMKPKIEAATKRHFPDGIPAFGTDALRFTFAALASTGRDIRFDLGRIEGYRNFCNKIWNATRYVLQNVESEDCFSGELSLADRWILARFQQVSTDTSKHLNEYRFDLATRDLYEFVWNDYCDWYIELSKPILYSDGSTENVKRGARHTLVTVLEGILRLLHPIMPYITEELWQKIGPLAAVEGETIMLQPYPVADQKLIDQDAIAELEWVKQFIMGIRQIRSEMDIKPGKALPVLCQNGDIVDKERLDSNRGLLVSLARLESITWLEAADAAPESATSLVGEMNLLIPMEGLIDKDAELARLQKNIDRLSSEVNRIQSKLQNANFVDRAPEDIVEKERTKLAENQSALDNLKSQSIRISAM